MTPVLVKSAISSTSSAVSVVLVSSMSTPIVRLLFFSPVQLHLFTIAKIRIDNYQSDIKEPFSDLLAGQPSLMTEWSDGGSTWTPTWDISGNNFEGMQWAIYLHNAFIKVCH